MPIPKTLQREHKRLNFHTVSIDGPDNEMCINCEHGHSLLGGDGAYCLETGFKIDWDLFLNHIEKTDDPELLQTLEKIKTNQSRLEVIGNYLDYFADVIDEPIREESVQISA